MTSWRVYQGKDIRGKEKIWSKFWYGPQLAVLNESLITQLTIKEGGCRRPAKSEVSEAASPFVISDFAGLLEGACN
jgi:hypothetical protein